MIEDYENRNVLKVTSKEIYEIIILILNSRFSIDNFVHTRRPK